MIFKELMLAGEIISEKEAYRINREKNDIMELFCTRLINQYADFTVVDGIIRIV